MDDDYSVFSILPPYNTISAQLIDPSGHRVTNADGIHLYYRGMYDPASSINTSSVGKSNFWRYSLPLFGVSLLPDQGLAGSNMPGPRNVPQPMAWDPVFQMFTATGIPIAPWDDRKRPNTYPVMRLIARNSFGVGLASVDIVLPVSSEVDCRGCHASGSDPKARPAAGWVRNPYARRDHRLNILRLHDEKNLANPVYQAALAANSYLATGLYDTVEKNFTPILCATCHASEALGAGGYPGVKSLSASLHGYHGLVVDRKAGLRLNADANRTSCYQCHPGSTTKCLRGVMGSAVAPDGSMEMQCQSCHGRMLTVGNPARTGWLDEPNCQACHTGTATSNSGRIVYTSVFDSGQHMRVPANQTFATNPNTPAAGKSLYRFSKGHGGMQCEACHGSTHAEFPTWTTNDNITTTKLQGHKGVLAECRACHATMPTSSNGGPHGLHPIGQYWVNQHGHTVENGGSQACQSCHGANYRGTRLSRTQGNRSFSTGGGSTKSLWAGQTIGCYECHNGPNGGGAMHPIGQSWVNQHPGVVDNSGAQACQSCHGADYRGTGLSRAGAARVFTVEDGGTKTFSAGQTIGCYDCHNGPGGGDGDRISARAPFHANGGSLILPVDQPKSINLHASGSGPLTLRIVNQPKHGTVGLQDAIANYYPDPGYVGADSFTFAASNGFVESNLSTTKVRVAGMVNGAIDFVPPIVAPNLPTNRSSVQGPDFTVTGIATDENGIELVEFRVGAGPWQAAEGTSSWSAAIAGVASGPVTISFRTTDAAGNESATISRAYTVF